MSKQCDESNSTCNRCAKSPRVCLGHTDVLDLAFRDETATTERRVYKAKRKKVPVPKMEIEISFPIDPSETERLEDFADSSVRPEIAQLPAPSIGECIAYHFVSNFVLITPSSSDGGHFDFIIPLIKMRNPLIHFKLAFEACALAYFSNCVGNATRLEQVALEKYTKALSTTGQALQNHHESRKDATIAAVLLLGLFEIITSRNPDIIAWSTHTRAAIELVEQRGQEQLSTCATPPHLR